MEPKQELYRLSAEDEMMMAGTSLEVRRALTSWNVSSLFGAQDTKRRRRDSFAQRQLVPWRILHVIRLIHQNSRELLIDQKCCFGWIFDPLVVHSVSFAFATKSHRLSFLHSLDCAVLFSIHPWQGNLGQGPKVQEARHAQAIQALSLRESSFMYQFERRDYETLWSSYWVNQSSWWRWWWSSGAWNASNAESMREQKLWLTVFKVLDAFFRRGMYRIAMVFCNCRIGRL